MASFQNASYAPPPDPVASVAPPVAMPDPLAGGASFPAPAPPPPETNFSPEPGFEPKAKDIPLAGGQSIQPPAPPVAPAAPHAAPSLNSGITMIRGGAIPAHEVATMGPKTLQHLDNANEALQKANERVASIQETAAAHQAASAQVAKDEATAQMQGAQAAQAEEQRRVAAAGAKVQQASQGLDRPLKDFWSDQSTGTKIGLTIAAMLGQAGAGIARQGGTNPVMAIIDNAMQADLKTKQMNYQRGLDKKSAAQQDFNNVVHQIGMAPAAELYQSALKAKIAAEAQQQAAIAKTPEIQANAIQQFGGLIAKSEEQKANATKLVAQQKVEPKYALPGNPIPVPASAAFGALEKRGEQAAEQQNKLDIAGLAKQGKTDEGTKFVAEQMQHAKIPERLAAINKAAQSMTPTEANPDAREGIGPVADYVKEIGGSYGYSKYYGEAAGKREQDWEQVTAAIKNSITGAGMSDKERERLDAMLEGAKSPEARANSIDTIRRELQEQMNTIGAGAGPEAYARYQQNLQQVAPTKISETPVKK